MRARCFIRGERLRFERDSINQAMGKGIALVHQELALIPQLSVGENIYLGREPSRAGIINWHRLFADTKQTLAQYGLDLPFATKVGRLSVGKQQMVEIARALAENAQILILDEPTSALTESEVSTLMSILRNLRKQGKTCLYISHKLEELFEITDQVTVLRDGQVVDTLQTNRTSSEEIIAMMVGRQMTERFPAGNRKPAEVILEVEGLSSFDPEQGHKQVVKNVSFKLRKGEILGVAGLMGSGRSELVTSLFGAYGNNTKGRVRIEGGEVMINSPRAAMDQGISLIPEDRKRMGLIVEQSILKNLSLPNLDQFAGFGTINKHKELNECQKIAPKPFRENPHPERPGQLALRGQPAKGGDRQVAVALAQGPDPGRTHPGHRRGGPNTRSTSL